MRTEECEIDSPFHENFSFGRGNFFVALSSCVELDYLFLYGHYSFFYSTSPPIATFVTHDETNQAMNKLKQIEQYISNKTNEAMCNKLDRSYKLSNTTNHVMCNK